MAAAPRTDGTLAGACLDMAGAVRNCVRLLSVPLTDALRFASGHPAEFLGLGGSSANSRPAFAPTWSRSTATRLEVLDTWVAGADFTDRDQGVGGQVYLV